MIRIMSGALVDDLSKLVEGERRLAAGDVLFRAGDRVMALHLVAAGALRLTRTLPHGLELTLQRAGTGALLAEASLFVERYHCDATATESSLVRIVPLRRVRAALKADPALTFALIRYLAEEVQRTRSRAEMLTLKTVGERVDAWVALNGALPPKGHWHELASEIGVTPEALYRELARRRACATCTGGAEVAASPSATRAHRKTSGRSRRHPIPEI